MKTNKNHDAGLDDIRPEGDYVLLNGWMAVPKTEAESAVKAAKEHGDNGVYAVKLAEAIAAPALLEACEFAAKHLGPESEGDYCWEAYKKLTEAIAAATKS
jgi:hypothetical protein